MITTQNIRDEFLGYFKKNDHTIVPSSSLIPNNDPTLMFTNSGMVQFKNILTGMEKPTFPRAASIQKSVRAGGKHNDLDNVGYTVRHHTFFEMLGNFSFGDYFKEKAIYYAWDFLSNVLEVPKDKMLATIYHTDEEAYQLWKKIAGFDDSRIIRIATKDNFWQMGDTGPCGPCSEIFYDHGDKYWGGKPGTKDEDGDRFIEIWNLVFDQYEDLANGDRIPLKSPSIDTGSGLERIVALLQGTNDNFDIDIFKNLIQKTAALAGVDPNGVHKTSLRVIADHLRSACFLIIDGVFPSNEGRGYVLRRIMRRAMRHVYLLGYKAPLMYQLVPFLTEEMGKAYPELKVSEPLTKEILRLEEEKFRLMLERGLRLLDNETTSLKKGDALSGDVAFKLYDTFGFPLDLTQDSLRKSGIKVDVSGFEKAMQTQREEARKNWVGSGDNGEEKVFFDLKEKFGSTEFLGYKTLQAEGEVLALVKDGKETASLKEGESGFLIVNQTPFYGEIGGQVGDKGKGETKSATLLIDNTERKVGSLFAHHIQIQKGTLSLHDNILLTVEKERRHQIERHHSATHLLQSALKQVLGDTVSQKGSLVTEDALRFDYSCLKAPTAKELQKVEHLVNVMILKNKAVSTRIMSPEEAKKEGAMALFGEKYGKEVRVVSMGDEAELFSMELCGGTHVKATGDIGAFLITSDSSVSSGIRRIEAKVGLSAEKEAFNTLQLTKKISSLLKVPSSEISQKVEHLLKDKKAMEKEISELKKKLLLSTPAKESDGEKIKDFTFIGKILEDVPAKDLKGMIDGFKGKYAPCVVVLLSKSQGKISAVIGVSSELTAQYDAAELVKKALPLLGGNGGGGRKDLAQAGGSTPEKAAEVLSFIKKELAK
ncbi:MAG: alanine--tRNA ligase [Alphaproteobacteria bacterium]|nr:alanine--tRNA ligase [Alphaproteobacteria bacterium]